MSEPTDWRDWIGRTRIDTDRVDAGVCRKMEATLGRPPSLADGDPLPPAWHWLLFHDAVPGGDLGPDGHPRLGIVMPPVPLPRRMWAGGHLEFVAPLVIGEQVDRTSTFTSIEEKRGRSGTLVFVTVEHRVAQRGQDCVVERQDVVYREMPTAAVVVEPEPAPATSDASAAWQLDTTALFRYSALTFNGHRIHYDADYCRQVEGYPDPVVHGPLIATLLLDLAARHGRRLHRFDYRARSPLFVGHPFTTHLRATGDTTDLWAAGAGGGLAMSARAE